ncbi:hypothetical protein, partial [Pseudomonas abietaniphila]|uniref:hypothetical protein n=1 Tax=Pseudomonas abietaniphila TaxID=89065 RepID=UPI001ABF8469
GGAFFNAEFGIRHRGSTVPERSGVALSFCRRLALGSINSHGGDVLGLSIKINRRLECAAATAECSMITEDSNATEGD